MDLEGGGVSRNIFMKWLHGFALLQELGLKPSIKRVMYWALYGGENSFYFKIRIPKDRSLLEVNRELYDMVCTSRYISYKLKMSAYYHEYKLIDGLHFLM